MLNSRDSKQRQGGIVSPKGSDQILPPVEKPIEISYEALLEAIAFWDETLSEYIDLLFAEVIEVPEVEFIPNLYKRGNWFWNPNTHAYRNREAGITIGEIRQVNVRNRFVRRIISHVIDVLVIELLEEDMTLTEWLLEMRRVILNAHASQFLLGVGGINRVDDEDRVSLMTRVVEQLEYLQRFAQEIQQPRHTEAYIKNRIRYYGGSSVASFEAGKAKSYGVSPPALPADGTSPCIANCRCWFLYRRTFRRGGRRRQHEEHQETVQAYWRLRPEPIDCCETCLERNKVWNPILLNVHI